MRPQQGEKCKTSISSAAEVFLFVWVVFFYLVFFLDKFTSNEKYFKCCCCC